MPIVEISLFEGRSEELKATIAREVAATVAEYTQNSVDAVHVVFNEKRRDQWARGTVLASRRATSDREPQRAEAATLSKITYDPDREQDYLAWRRDVLHPGMAQMPGYVGARLYRTRNENTYHLLLDWMTAADQQHYKNSPQHDAFRETALSLLPEPLETIEMERVHLDFPK